MYVGLKQPLGDGQRYVTPARAAAKETKFVAPICRTNSNQFEFVRQTAATKSCRSDNNFRMSPEAICCSNLSRRRVAAICRPEKPQGECPITFNVSM